MSIDPKQVLIIGANGQLGHALQKVFPDAVTTNSEELDITDSMAVGNFHWEKLKVVVNAAAYTDVDGAESPKGRVAAWQVNASALGHLTKIALEKDLILVHFSTDYVFDGTKNPHLENESFSPLGVYGQSKAAGDIVVKVLPKHYLVRTSWLIGDGQNFVRTMLQIAKDGVDPVVISDNIGRPTFASEVARATSHLFQKGAAFGTYNVSNSGDPVSWADFARTIYKTAQFNLTVSDTTNDKYYANKPAAAPRPRCSVFDLSKVQAAGFRSKDWREELDQYIAKELAK